MPANLKQKTVLGFFPHPDDESYAAGGTLALCARQGARVEILCASRGEAAIPRLFPKTTSNEMGAIRSRELEAACRALGAHPPRLLGLPDGAMNKLDEETVADKLKGIIVDLRPHLIITLGEDGVYGHADHIFCTRVLLEAVRGLSGAYTPRVLLAAFPEELFRPVYRALRKVPGVPLDAAYEDRRLGNPPEDIDLRVRIQDVRDVKLKAISAHRSQLVKGDPYSLLGKGMVDELLSEECFIRAWGPALRPANTGIMAGL